MQKTPLNQNVINTVERDGMHEGVWC
jgi:hypothetical protein